jgi:hypothetical protein
MALRSGQGASVGFGAETTYGTYFAPTRHLEFVSEGLAPNREVIESNAIRKGSTMRRSGRWLRNNKGAGGDTNFEVSTKGFGLIFKHAIGESAITTPGGATLARQHRYTVGDLDDLSLTIQKGVPQQSDGVANPMSFLGCVCTNWTMAVEVDGLLTFGTTWDAQDHTAAQALVAASFPTGELFGYQDIGIALDGAANEPRSLSLTCDNAVATDRYVINATGKKRRPVLAGFRTVSGSMEMDFDTMTNVNYFLDQAPGEEFDIVVTATHPDLIEASTPYSLTATMPDVTITDGYPTVGGPDLITVTVAWEVRDPAALEPLTLDYVTTDTAD